MDPLPPETAALMKALAEREELVRSLFENPLAAIVVSDAEGRIRSASPAALALLGLELEDALGHSFEALLDPASPRPVPDGAVHALTLGGVPRREVHYAAQRLQDGLQVAVLAGA